MRQKFNNPFSEAVSIVQFFVVEMLDHLFFVIFFLKSPAFLLMTFHQTKKRQQLN